MKFFIRETIKQSSGICSNKESGFTIIEVSTAMFFVAFIMLILAATTVNLVRAYNKGVHLSSVNATGQQLIADISDNGRYSEGQVKVINNQRRLCIGKVSYIWNTAKQLDANSVDDNYFDTSYPGASDAIGLVRIEDPNGSYCQSLHGHYPRPKRNDPRVRVLLGRGSVIESFGVKQGVASDEKVPLLKLSLVISADGRNRPVKVKKTENPQDGLLIVNNYDDPNSEGDWQCGDYWDKNHDGRVNSEDLFKPSENSFCAFSEYSFIVYERSIRR